MLIKFPKSQFSIPQLCVGTWQAQRWAKSDAGEFSRIVHWATDNGLNFFDTARSYGESETLLGQALGTKRKEAIIATKIHWKSNTPQKLLESLQKSLQALKTDYIDILQIHWPPSFEYRAALFEHLEKLKSEGLIRAFGVCNWSETEFNESSHRELELISSVHNCYSLLWRRPERAELELSQKSKALFLAYSPLAQGLLSDRSFDPDQLPKDPRKQNVLFYAPLYSKVSATLKTLKEHCQDLNCSLSELALRWLIYKGVLPVIGCTKLSQLQSAKNALDLNLDPESIAIIEKASKWSVESFSDHESLWGWHPLAKRSKPRTNASFISQR